MELEDNKTWSKAINRKRKQQNHGKKWRKNEQTQFTNTEHLKHVVKLKFKNMSQSSKRVVIKESGTDLRSSIKNVHDKKDFSSDGQQFHQYQLNEQLSFKSSHWTQKSLTLNNANGNSGPGLR